MLSVKCYMYFQGTVAWVLEVRATMSPPHPPIQPRCLEIGFRSLNPADVNAGSCA